ncbi:MAG: S49 family peptidase, partial [Leptospiraceae bacterium]|nr:S49 family peptidase [Leptospiraceae bacterium]
LRGDYCEAPPTQGLWSWLKPGRDRFYFLVLELFSALEAYRRKKLKIRHLAVRIENHNLGWAQAWELRRLILDFRAASVTTSCWLLTDDRISLYIATACEHVFAAEGCTFDLSPFTAESLYAAPFLKKLGIRPQFIAVGEFKSAAEIFTRSNMSKAERQQLESLLKNLNQEFGAALGGRNPALARASGQRLLSAREAVQNKLIDATASAEEYAEWLAANQMLPERDLAVVQKIIRRKLFRLLPFRRLPRIALVVAEGAILESTRPLPGTINTNDYAQVTETLKRGGFDAAIVRINSPGGSALVSQHLWREWMLATHRLEAKTLAEKNDKKRKESKAKIRKKDNQAKAMPVLVSQGNVAASGGYYLSAVGEEIFCTPLTITGSIGVIGGKFNLAPFLARLGIHVDRAPLAGEPPLFSAFADFSPGQKSALRKNMQAIYQLFLEDVATGRNLKPEKLQQLAKGRVYSGGEAVELGLADKAGGLVDALKHLRQKLGLAESALIELAVMPVVRESLFSPTGLPGMAQLAALAKFARPGVYALDPRWL